MNFSDKRVTVIGDIMLDYYYLGEVYRLAQEAPVITFKQFNLKPCLGAAANAALNCVRLGAEVQLIGVLGNDADGDTVYGMLEDEKITPRVVHQQNILTNIKNRYCDTRTYHQVFRSDIDEQPPDSSTIGLLVEQIKDSIKTADVIIVSDYGKGVICHETMDALKGLRGIFIGIDPHPANRLYYSRCNANLYTPNEPEAIEMAWRVSGSFWGPGDYIIVSRGKHGMFGRNCYENSDFELPAHTLHPICVVGAGDVVVTVASLCLAAGNEFRTACEIANHAAGQAVRRPFTSTVFDYELDMEKEV